MDWLKQFFAAKPALTPEQEARMHAWRALPEPSMQSPIADSRYVVVDVESSGLNIAKDRLIAIGAVAIVHGKIRLGDSLEIVLQQTAVSDNENILIHGIGGTAQRSGTPPADALLTFLEYLDKDPLIAFHSDFDEGMIGRAVQHYLGIHFRHVWTDLAYVAPALYPQLTHRNRSLDDWLSHFHIGNYARHSALADAQATAELMLALSPALRKHSVQNVRDLRALERAQRNNRSGF